MILDSNDLNNKLILFHDLKKKLAYNKHSNKWAYGDSDSLSGFKFTTALEAIEEAIEPYISNQND